jgi:hypothetical protein
MKLTQLKSVIKEAVKEAIQEEMKDILLEAVRSPNQTIYENRMGIPTTDVAPPSKMNPVATKTRKEIRENMMNVLGGMMPGANGTLSATTQDLPLQVSTTDTANGALPEGNVSVDQIMQFVKK